MLKRQIRIDASNCAPYLSDTPQAWRTYSPDWGRMRMSCSGYSTTTRRRAGSSRQRPASSLPHPREEPRQEMKSGLRIRSIFGRIRLRILQIRILKLDPDPGSYWHLKSQFKHLNFFHIKHISSDIWMMIIVNWKNGKIHLKMCETSFFKIFFPCLYNFTLPKYW